MQIFKFTFKEGNAGIIWGPNRSTIDQAKAIVGLDPVKVEKIDETDRLRLYPFGQPKGWYFG